ncbi:hypothetical protein ACWCXH_31285 [Kitasatospora sp. NPDC001660]
MSRRAVMIGRYVASAVLFARVPVAGWFGVCDVLGLRTAMRVMTGLLALCGALPLVSPLRTVREPPTGHAVITQNVG